LGSGGRGLRSLVLGLLGCELLRIRLHISRRLAVRSVQFIQIHDVASGRLLLIVLVGSTGSALPIRLLQVVCHGLLLVVGGARAHELRLVEAVALLLHHENELLIREH
jgi:hypothetical protein